MFQNLKVVGLGASASYQATFGSVLNPMTAIEQLQNILHPPLRDILSGFEGVVRPGEMLRRGIFLSSYSNLAQAILFQLFSDVLVQAAPHSSRR